MRKSIKPLITLFSAGLFLWLLWEFWSLGRTISIFITLLVIVITGVFLFWYRKQQLHTIDTHFIDALPPQDYQGAIVLVCGQSAALFAEQQSRRETALGWYLPIHTPSELTHYVQTIAEYVPSLFSRLSILYAVLPEQIIQTETLAQDVLDWRRAIEESRLKINHNLPFWVSVYLSNSDILDQDLLNDNQDSPWFTLLKHQPEFVVEQEGTTAKPFSVWSDSPQFNHQQILQNSLWFDALLDWLNTIFVPMLTTAQTGAPILTPSAWAIQWSSVNRQLNNIWQQYIETKTGLPLIETAQTSHLLPLPDVLLRRLNHDVSLSQRERLIGIIGLIFGIFLVGALCGSYQHNRQLIRHIGEDAARFLRLPDSPLLPKETSYRQLQNDAAELARWEREGIPTAYSLALYQGSYLLPYLQTLLSSWAPPSSPTPAPVIIQQAPQMISLDSLALFDVGQYTLKTNATKVLVNALINIQAKYGWLIVVSGYTDNTGNPELNQKISLKRAESVRDWMIETSDIDPTCFAVQGYGQNHPIADNDTTEGRARNRRVEIRLMPQADACRALSNKTVQSMDDGTHSTMKEK